MDESRMIENFMKPQCKVKVGDRIYRKVKNMTIPDRMEILEVIPTEDGHNIHVRYMYHAIGPFERTYRDSILNEDWVIERKGVDF